MDQTNVMIGLEVHCQLTALKTKLFCGCSADFRGKPPNTCVCPVCLGLPGSLPVYNRRALELALMVTLALETEIPLVTYFYRKNYFYPDLPKNFQISQYDKAGGIPLGMKGKVTFTFNDQRRTITIRRIQLEEDPGRLHYAGAIDSSPYTLVDYNRSGITLVEIVTEPEFRNPKEVRVFLQKLRSILEHLDVSNGSLEGAMRCDANISIEGGSRIEVKNISSFKEVERALNFEIIRQRDLVKKGVFIKMQTRHWDELRRITVELRTKEEEEDYRYFPEPDLVPIHITRDMLEALRKTMPELPDSRKQRFMATYGLSEYDSEVLTIDRGLADFFEKATENYGKPKPVANWLMGDVLQCLHTLDEDINESKITPPHLVEMLNLIDSGVISIKIAKKILWDVARTGKMPAEIVREQKLGRIVDASALKEMAERVFLSHRDAVQDALKDEKAIHYLLGQLMALTQGQADPEMAIAVIKEKLQQMKTT